MSAKLVVGGSTFPTECIKGDLSIFIGEDTYHIELPFIAGQVFPKSNAYFTSDKIFVYLKNDKFQVVLRWDGTATVYTLDNTVVLIKRFELPDFFNNYKMWERCSVRDSNKENYYKVDLINKDEHYWIDCGYIGEMYHLQIQENKEFYQDLFNATYFYPILMLGKDKNGDTVLNVVDEKAHIRYTLTGDWVSVTDNLTVE